MLLGQFILMFEKFKLLNNIIILKLEQTNNDTNIQQPCNICEQLKKKTTLQLKHQAEFTCLEKV